MLQQKDTKSYAHTIKLLPTPTKLCAHLSDPAAESSVHKIEAEMKQRDLVYRSIV